MEIFSNKTLEPLSVNDTELWFTRLFKLWKQKQSQSRQTHWKGIALLYLILNSIPTGVGNSP